MKNNKDIISIFSTDWGHKSIGEAVEDALKSNYHTNLNYIRSEQIGFKSYQVIYQLFPNISKIPFKVSENDQISRVVKKYVYAYYFKKVEKLIKEQKPKFVVSVYFGFTLALEKLSKKYGFKLINIVSDPRTFHKLSLSYKTYNLVFDKKSIKRCKNLNINSKFYIQSGWFVRSEFQKTISKESVKISLGINPKLFTICVIGGSEGSLNILKILPAFLSKDKKIQVIIICGNNKKLYNSLDSLLKIISKDNTRKTKFIIKGFIKNTHKYLQASDLIIGKAGPNLLFESVAVETPFFAISHISGQEDGNLEIIKEYKIGLVEENATKAIEITKNIINNPKILDRYSKNIKKLALYNRNSYSVLKKLISTI